jgi:competence protein ComEC
VVADPAAVTDLSSQLSFLAVLSLILVSPALRDALPFSRPDSSVTGRWRYRLQKLREVGLQTFCASVAVTVAGLPLCASEFHRFSIAGLFSNMIALPLCPPLTALAAGGAFMHAFWPGGAVPWLWAGTWLASALDKLARVFAVMPGAALGTPSMPPVLVAALLTGVLAFSLNCGLSRRLGLLAPLSLVLWVLSPWRFQPALAVTFLAVGQGDAIVISSRGQHAMIDGGGSPGGRDPGKRVVIPFLRETRISALELAVLTHPHPDHALGLASTLQEIPTRTLWVPAGVAGGALTEAVAAAAGMRPVEVERGHPQFVLGEAQLEVAGPPEERTLLEGVNDRSVVLLLRHGEVTFLLTGDIEAAAEEEINVGQVTVLKAAHHGSRTSSTPEFIRKVQPRYVVFCVGRRNRFRFPHPEIEQRFEQAGAQCFRTDIHGAVRFESDGKDVRWTTFHSGSAPTEDSAIAESDPRSQLERP